MREFRVDLVAVIEGRGPSPRLVIQLVQGLPDTSLTSALLSGGRDHFGWGQDRHLAADLIDALNANTRATGNWGRGKAPTIPPYPRPTSKPGDGAKKKVSVRDLFSRFGGKATRR